MMLDDIQNIEQETHGCTLVDYFMIIYRFKIVTTQQLTNILDAYFYDTN